MSLRQFLFENGPAGTSITGTLLGGASFALVNKGGGTSTLTAAAAQSGATGAEFVTTATGQYNIARLYSVAAADRFAASYVFSYLGTGAASSATAETTIAGLRCSTTDLNPIGMKIDALNRVYFIDYALVSLSGSNLKYTIEPGVKYRVEIVADRTAGTATVNLYTATGTTPVATWAATTANLGPSTINGLEFGVISANQAMTVRIDNVQLDDGRTTQIGSYDSSSTPLSGTGTLTPTAGEVPLTVTSTFTAAGGSGTGRQHSWTWGDGQSTGPQASNTATHTYSTPGSFSPSGLITEPA